MPEFKYYTSGDDRFYLEKTGVDSNHGVEMVNFGSLNMEFKDGEIVSVEIYDAENVIPDDVETDTPRVFTVSNLTTEGVNLAEEIAEKGDEMTKEQVVEALRNAEKLYRCDVCGEEKETEQGYLRHYVEEHGEGEE